MRTIFTLLLTCCLFSLSAQETKTFTTPLPAGDVQILNISTKMQGRRAMVTYELQVPATAAYYINAFGSFTQNAKTFFSVQQRGAESRAAEAVLPVARNGWQVQPASITEGRPVTLTAGIQQVSFFTESNAFPLIDRISITRSGTDNEFNRHTSGFISKLEQLSRQTPIVRSKTNEDLGKVLGNPEASYEHQVDETFAYSTFVTYYLTAGTIVTFETKNSTQDPVLHLFDAASPDTRSWSNDDFTGVESKLTVAIPVTAYYTLLVRPYYDNVSGTTDLYKDNVLTNSATPIGGRRFDNNITNTGDRNFFTCRLTGTQDTRLFTLTQSSGLVKGYNDDYAGTGDWSWGRASRVAKNFTALTKVTYICAYSTSTTGTCDTYMGNPNSAAYTDWAFPNYKQNDCIQSAPGSGVYNCISWSGGITSYWEWPLDPGSSYYVAGNGLQSFDNFYKNTPKRYGGAYNYTRTGATVDNAMVDLWKIPNGNYTHGSVTKPGNNNPHGYNWESKPGGLERSFHPRNALNGPGYGQVSNYYRHDGTYAPFNIVIVPGGLRTVTTDADAVKLGTDVFDEAQLSSGAKAKLGDLVRKTDGNLAMNFENLYRNWKATWKENAAFSDPRAYTNNDAYRQLLGFSLKNTDMVLPALFKLFTNSNDEVLAGTLLWQLTEKRYAPLMDEVKRDNLAKPNDDQGRYIIRSMYGNYVRFIEKILRGFDVAAPVAVSGISVTISPNPVRNRFSIGFSLNTAAPVTITLASAQTGRKMMLLNETLLQTGAHQYTADAAKFAGGTGDMISIQVTVNGITTTTKAMIGQ